MVYSYSVKFWSLFYSIQKASGLLIPSEPRYRLVLHALAAPSLNHLSSLVALARSLNVWLSWCVV